MIKPEIGFETGAQRRARTRWPHCWRCGLGLNRYDDPDKVDGLCRDCRENFFERAHSYGGTKAEIQTRYWDIVEFERVECERIA